MQAETVYYQSENVTFKGYLVWPDEASAEKRPAVLVAHTWKGQDDFAREKAQALAELGYIGFAVDLYGQGQVANNDEEASKLMLPLFLDRSLLQRRLKAAVNLLEKHPLIDANAIGAIGFCFGGLSVIELLRSGSNVKGVVSFHGLLGNNFGEHKATPAKSKQVIKSALLILHGNDDPFVSQQDLESIKQELSEKKVDWQMNIYGHTTHAFTNPQADDKAKGMCFNQQTTTRAWQAMVVFFEEIFGKETI